MERPEWEIVGDAEADSLGYCYGEALDYVLDNGGILVHGSKTVVGQGFRCPSILHAWVLVGDNEVFDPADKRGFAIRGKRPQFGKRNPPLRGRGKGTTGR